MFLTCLIYRQEDVYQSIMFQYTNWPYVQDPVTNRAMLGDVSIGSVVYVKSANKIVHKAKGWMQN